MNMSGTMVAYVNHDTQPIEAKHRWYWLLNNLKAWVFPEEMEVPNIGHVIAPFTWIAKSKGRPHAKNGTSQNALVLVGIQVL